MGVVALSRQPRKKAAARIGVGDLLPPLSPPAVSAVEPPAVSAVEPRQGRGEGTSSVPRAVVRSTAQADIRIGFVTLIDAAPIIAAHELGYFADAGLRVCLERQIGWGNVRDKLTYGHLHASHALLGMAPASVLKSDWYPEPLVSICELGVGGNAITFSRRLTDRGIEGAAAIARWVHQARLEGPPAVAHVFTGSMHHYLLREWLAAGGVDPDRDVRLCVRPPEQVVAQLAQGYLDAFCVGEPWNTVAVEEGHGVIVAATADVLPNHPEKVLAVTRRWLGQHRPAAVALVRAILRGGAFCHDPANRSRLTEILVRSAHIDVPEAVVARSLSLPPRFRSFSPAAMFPSATHVAWLVRQMMRWGHLPAETAAEAVARESIDAGPFREAAAAMSIPCPETDAPPMRLAGSIFRIGQTLDLETTVAARSDRAAAARA